MAKPKKVGSSSNDPYRDPVRLGSAGNIKNLPRYGIGKPALSAKPAGGPLAAYLKRTSKRG